MRLGGGKGQGPGHHEGDVDDGELGKWNACEGLLRISSFPVLLPSLVGHGSGRHERDHEEFRQVHCGGYWALRYEAW